MKRLPHWVLTDTFPAFYDSESLTATQQTARVYAAMQELIDSYNKFVDEINGHIDEHENALEKDICEFKTKIIHTMENYIQFLDTKMNLQDVEITKIAEDMKNTLPKIEELQQQIDQMVIEGDSSVEAAQARVDANGNVYTTLKERLDTQDTKVSILETVSTENKRGLSYWWIPEQQQPARTDEEDYFINAYTLTPDETIENYFEPLRTANPDYVTRESLGKDTSNTYDVYKYEFTPKNPTKTIVLSSGTHGSEITGVIVMIRFLHYLINEYEKYPLLSYIRENIKIVYVPFVNPWGTSQSPRTRYNVNGVDINRNFDYKWDEFVGGEAFSHDYKGTSAFSEKESQYIRDLLIEYSDAIAYLDLHNTGDPLYDYYVSYPENYPYKTYDKIVGYFAEKYDRSNLNVVELTTPSGFNYAYAAHGVPSSNPEWCDGSFGSKKYDSEEITRAVEFMTNVIIEHCREFERVVKPLMFEDYFTLTGTNISITDSTITKIEPFYKKFSAPSDGFVTYEGFVVVKADSTGTMATICPVIGQTGSTPSYDELVTSRFDVFETLAGDERAVIPFYAQMPVKKTDGVHNLTVGYGLTGKTDGNGSFNVMRYRARITFTPSNYENFKLTKITATD